MLSLLVPTPKDQLSHLWHRLQNELGEHTSDRIPGNGNGNTNGKRSTKAQLLQFCKLDLCNWHCNSFGNPWTLKQQNMAATAKYGKVIIAALVRTAIHTGGQTYSDRKALSYFFPFLLLLQQGKRDAGCRFLDSKHHKPGRSQQRCFSFAADHALVAGNHHHY